MSNTIAPITLNQTLPSVSSVNQAAPQTSGPSFSDFLKSAVEDVNNQQNAADQATVQLASGTAPDLSTVMITTEKAQLSFQLAVQIRNKALESYQEIMRMQM